MPPAFDKLFLRPFRPLYLIGVGTVVGLSASFFDSWHGKITCRPVAFTESLWMRGFPWLLLGLFALPVASFCARFPLRGSSRVIATRLGMHLVAAVVNGVVFEVTINGITWLVGRVDHFWRSTVESMSVYGNGLLTFYFTVLGVTHAVLYYRESRERERAQARLEAGLIEARLDALRAQLNPHFLFNTLNAIAGLALRGEGAGVAQAIGKLSEILRASLDTRRGALVPLAEEMELVRAYVDIQAMRYGDRLSVALALSPGVGDALVPTLVTQPLVENAVRHGIAVQPGPGLVEVSAQREGDVVVIRVADSGPGFETVPATEGIGLSNTRERLERHYGAAASLLCANAPEGGAVVTLRLPFRAAALAEAS